MKADKPKAKKSKESKGKGKNEKFLEPKKVSFKYPDFNVSSEPPNGGYVHGKGGGSTPIRTPRPDNSNANTIPFKKR